MSVKNIVIDQLVVNALSNLEAMDISDEECDTILDDAVDDLMVVLTLRCTFRSLVPKSSIWLREILPTIDDRRFKQFIRVTRQQFNVILQLIENHSVFNGENSCHQLPIATQLSLVLLRFGSNGTGAAVNKISGLFGLGDGGTLDKITKRVMQAILGLEKQFVYWPNLSERETLVAETFDELPRCIGYVDGTEIYLEESPSLDHVSYYSRKQRYCIKAQVICDYKLKIRHIFVGFPGSVHNARIFANTDISRNPDTYFSDNQWLAGDSVYRLTKTVLTPFRKNATRGTMKQRQNFNKYFSSFCVRIENCFGILKEKFGSLKELRMRIKDKASHKFACEWFTATCVLFNIIHPYLEDEDYELTNTDPNDDDGADSNEGQVSEVDGEIKRLALFKLILEKLNF